MPLPGSRHRVARLRRRAFRHHLAGLALAVVGLALAAPAAPAAPPLDDAARAMADDLVTTIAALRDRTADDDPRYWDAGRFVTPDPACPVCRVGPATAAAVVRDVDPSAPAWLDQLAIATMDRTLATLNAQDLVTDDGTTDPIHTMFFANELGTALLHLRGRLPAATRRRWTAGLVRMADRFVRRGELRWYSNGNLQLGYTETMLLTWLATGDQQYRRAYRQGWDFALRPPRTSRWRGRGLVLTRAGRRRDGADGAGYLTEKGTSVGYDPSYTQLQVDVVTRIYLLTRDPAVLRVLNLLTNQLLGRVDATFMLDIRGGSRIDKQPEPFSTAALTTLVASGARPDLAGLAVAHRSRLLMESERARLWGTHIQYRAVGTELAVAVQAMVEGPDATPPRPESPARRR